MRILITGAAGFVGTHLIAALKEKKESCELFAWVKDEKEAGNVRLERTHVFVVDITKKEQVFESLRQIKPDEVYHLAAQSSVALSWKMPDVTYEVNVMGTLFLLEGLKDIAPGANVLLVGSAEQYGKVGADELPISENCQLQGVNPYSISKMTQELMARMYVESFGMHLVLVRAFNHIGPGQSTRFVIPDWCSQVVLIEQGKKQPVLKVGNIEVKRDFTDVRDIVSAYILLAQKGLAGEVYNVGSGTSHTLKEVLEQIISSSHAKNIVYEIDENKLRPADVKELRADIARLMAVTGWRPKYTLEQSITDILEEMRNR